MSKLYEAPSAPKREHPAIQNFYLLTFSIFVIVYARLDPDPDSMRIHADRDPKLCGNVVLVSFDFCAI
jgi:hypothetical protein